MSGLPFPSPGDLPDLGIEPGSPALQADSLPNELSGKPTLEKNKVYIKSLLQNLSNTVDLISDRRNTGKKEKQILLMEVIEWNNDFTYIA